MKSFRSPDVPFFTTHQNWYFSLSRAIALLSLLLVCSGAARATITYTISIEHPENHLFYVTMSIPDVHDGVTIQMPAWNATYQIRDFASRIQNLQAIDENKKQLPIVKVDKQTWRIAGTGKTIDVAYEIFWDDPSPFGSQLNSTHAFMNLAEILVYVPDRRSEVTAFGFVVPPMKVATSPPRGRRT